MSGHATKLAAVLLAAAASALPASAAEIREIAAKPGERVRVDLDTGGTIRVVGWERSLVQIEAESRVEGGAKPELVAERTSRGIEISSRPPSGKHRWHGGIDVVLRVPSRIDLELGSAGGGLSVEGISGKLGAITRGGDVELREVTGSVDVTTLGGNIRLEGCDLSGSVTTQGGHIHVVDLTGSVEVKTQGGNVSFQGGPRPESCEPVRISTQGGNIVASAAPCGAMLESMGGNVMIRDVQEFVEANTMGGNVTIDAASGRVRAATAGGDIEVRMTGDSRVGDHSVRLASKNGDVTLTLPADISADFDISLSFTRNSDQDYSIESDFPLEIRKSPTWDYGSGAARKYLNGTGSLAGGRHKIKLETVNGNIRIRRGSG